MQAATSLVMLMTPGLAIFYGGLVGRKIVLNVRVDAWDERTQVAKRHRRS